MVGDAARSKVPLSRRLSYWDNSIILWGWVLVLSSFLVGGIVGQSFPLKLAMPIIFLGTLSNGIVGALIGAAAARTGYSSALLYRYTFGRKGVVLPNVLMGLSSMGWFSVILNLTRDGFAEHWGWEAGSAPWLIATIAIGVLFIIPAVVRIGWIAYVDWIAVPGFLIMVFMIIKRHPQGRRRVRSAVEQVVRSHHAGLHRVRYGGRRLAGRGGPLFPTWPASGKTASRPWWGS